MAKKFEDFPDAASLNQDDILLVNQTGLTKKVTLKEWVKRKSHTVNYNYSVVTGDRRIFVDCEGGDVEIILPPASDWSGAPDLIIKHISGTGICKIIAGTGEHVDNEIDITLSSLGSRTLISNGTAWYTV